MSRATITRDRYGVPTITSSTLSGMWYGSGWAQAQDRMAQLELIRRTVEGTLSGLGGSGELSQDEQIRTFFYTPAEYKRQFLALPSATQAAISSYANGVNAYEAYAFAPARSSKLVPYEFKILGTLLGSTGGLYRPAPWTPEDTVAVGDYLARDFGGGGGSELSNLGEVRYLTAYFTSKGDSSASADAMAVFNDTRWINDPTAPTTVPSSGASSPGLGSSLSGSSVSGSSLSGSSVSGSSVSGSSVSGSSLPRSSAAAQLDSSVAQTTRSLAALAGIPSSDVLAAARTLRADRARILRTGIRLKVPSHDGSDAFVVAPSRTKDHHALLWGAPQEGFGTPSVDGEEYLHGPGYDAGGMYITGEPYILIGRNAKVGWTTTSEELVDQRVYSEKVRFHMSPPSYWYKGAWKPFTIIHETIPVEGAAPKQYTVYRTVDGPIFYRDPSHGVAFAMRFASWMHETGSLEGFSELGGDTTLSAFTASMKKVTTLHNFLYADSSGNIAYFGDGLVFGQPSGVGPDPRLPANGDGSAQNLGLVPWSQMPRSVNPSQGYLDNWNTKPSASDFYQQNGGDEYWGTIYRSSQISSMLEHQHSVTVAYLERIEHAIGTLDNGDNTRSAALYFIPFIESAYSSLVAANSPLVSPSAHPDLAGAMTSLKSWNGTSTLGSPAMSIFMNTMEILERNVCEGGFSSHDRYAGRVNLSESSLGLGTYGGLGGDCTYNFLLHVLAGTSGLVPCDHLCYTAPGGYFGGHSAAILVESVNDAIRVLSGTGQQLGQSVPGFGTSSISSWGYRPARDENWDSLDPAAAGFPPTHCGTSPSQNRSTFMMALDVGPTSVVGFDVLPPGQSGFLGQNGVASPHLCDQVGLFNSFKYKAMPNP